MDIGNIKQDEEHKVGRRTDKAGRITDKAGRRTEKVGLRKQSRTKKQ